MGCPPTCTIFIFSYSRLVCFPILSKLCPPLLSSSGPRISTSMLLLSTEHRIASLETRQHHTVCVACFATSHQTHRLRTAAEYHEMPHRHQRQPQRREDARHSAAQTRHAAKARTRRETTPQRIARVRASNNERTECSLTLTHMHMHTNSCDLGGMPKQFSLQRERWLRGKRASVNLYWRHGSRPTFAPPKKDRICSGRPV